MDSLLELFCDVDDFCQSFLPKWQKQLFSDGEIQRQRKRSLSLSEVMTILIHFHQSHYRDFKAYYTGYVLERLHGEFPGLVSYARFVEFIPSALIPLCVYLQSSCLGVCTGISFMDSTALAVCKNPRIHSHKVFAGLAERGKTSTGWFFGFKLHLIFNDRGELLNLMLTPGNADDRQPVPSSGPIKLDTTLRVESLPRNEVRNGPAQEVQCRIQGKGRIGIDSRKEKLERSGTRVSNQGISAHALEASVFGTC